MSKERKHKRERLEKRIETCSNKKTFYTRKSARHYAKKIKLLFNHDQKPYKCPICGNYHLTTVKEDKEDINNCSGLMQATIGCASNNVTELK